jgi:futalosine hydrolase
MTASGRPLPGAAPRVLLIGLAGSYDEERAPIGTAVAATAVACDGIGVGEGLAFQNAEEAGWRQGHALAGEPAPGDRVELDCPIVSGEGAPARGEFLSAAAASAGSVQAVRRARLFPAALAEDMETYAAALAARLAGARLIAVRGISNRAGDRRKSRWRPEEAMAAAREGLVRTLEGAAAGVPVSR